MTSTLEAITVRLAEEGVPLRAIARAVQVPSSDVYDQLCDARDEGRILDLPRDDWPPGCPRDQRALQLSRIAAAREPMLLTTISDLFGMTPKPARLLLRLTQHEQVARDEQPDIPPKSVDVHICKMRRKLEPFGVQINSLWGMGYRLPPRDRHTVMELILGKLMPGRPA